jgi:hypothetical protein
MRTVKKLGAVLAILACVSIGAGQSFAQHATVYFWITLPDIDWYGGFAETGWDTVGKAVINTKDGQVHARAETWVWNDAWRHIEYKGISGLYFYAEIPDYVLATFICKYKVSRDGHAQWSAKGWAGGEDEE